MCASHANFVACASHALGVVSSALRGEGGDASSPLLVLLNRAMASSISSK
jgi:hypothetical protein